MKRTLVDYARDGIVSPEVREVAAAEGIDENLLRERIAAGSAVVMQRGRGLVGIGRGLRTKVNVNLGTSTLKAEMADEIEKARIAEEFGADTISDLSMGGDVSAIRTVIFAHTSLPITTVPLYQAVAEHGLRSVTAEDILATMRAQADQGVSSMVVHCVNRKMLDAYRTNRRILGIVSKGGSMASAYMVLNACENPFIEMFDDLLAICRKHDIVLSLGNTARSGCIHDRRDAMQRLEMRLNAELAYRAFDEGVQVIIEGCGGHIRMDRIPVCIKGYKKISPFPLFVAGPLPTDIAAGYDHIAGCAGASLACAAGADYLCSITPSEHLGLPDPQAVKAGLIAFRIAAHIGDTVKYGRDNDDTRIAFMRAALDRTGQIRHALDPMRADELCDGGGECTMCGEFCAIKIVRDLFGESRKRA